MRNLPNTFMESEASAGKWGLKRFPHLVGARLRLGFAALYLSLFVWSGLTLRSETAQAQEKPQTEAKELAQDKQEPPSRDAELLKLIMQLQDEVKALRREVNQVKAELSASRPVGEGQRARRDSERERTDVARDNHEPERKAKDIEKRPGRERDELVEQRRVEREDEDRPRKKRRGDRDLLREEGVELTSTGVIKAMGREGKAPEITIAVKEDGKEMELICRLGEGARITLNGQPAEFDDLKPGDSVECRYVLKGEKMIAVARAIDAKR